MSFNMTSHQQAPHRSQRAPERVEDEAEDLQRDDAEQRLCVPWLAQDDRRMALALWRREVALRHGPVDGGPVGEDELHIPLGCEADGLPHRVGQERVGCAAVDEEANADFRPGRTADGALDVADTHAPKYGTPDGECRHPKIAARGKPTPGERRGSGCD